MQASGQVAYRIRLPCDCGEFCLDPRARHNVTDISVVINESLKEDVACHRVHLELLPAQTTAIRT